MSKPRRMLPNWEAPYIQSLVKLIETQSKETIANWCIDYAESFLLPIYRNSYPNDTRPLSALTAARELLAGKIKYKPQVKDAITDCQNAAKEADNNPASRAAVMAIGRCASSANSPSHCIGLALYGALAVAYSNLGDKASWSDLEAAAAYECGKMEKALSKVAVCGETNLAKLSWDC